MIKAYRTLDCARKVRVHYHLPAPLTEAFFAHFPEAKVSVQRFSASVVGAKDHFTIVQEARLYVAGVLGESRLVVTYGKSAWQWSPREIDAFESRLTAAGFGPVEYAAAHA